MKKVFLCFIAFLFLFCIVAPIFSFAANFQIVYPYMNPYRDIDNCIVGSSSLCGYVIGFDIDDNNVTSINNYLYYYNDYSSYYHQVRVTAPSGIAYDFYVTVYITNLITFAETSYKVHCSGTGNGSQQIFYHSMRALNNNTSSIYYYNVIRQNNCTITFRSQDYSQSTPFVSFSTSPYSEYVITSSLPKPIGNNRVYYIADHQTLYQIVLTAPYDYQELHYDGMSQTDDYIDDPYSVYLLYNQNFYYMITNTSSSSIDIFINTYSLVNGYFISSVSQTINANSSSIFNLYLMDADTMGIWYSGDFIISSLGQASALSIRWSDSIDYSNDFSLMNSYLSNQLNTLNSFYEDFVEKMDSANYTLDLLYSYIGQIRSKLYDFYDLGTTFYSWVTGTYYPSVQGHWLTVSSNLNTIKTYIVLCSGYLYRIEEMLSGTDPMPTYNQFETNVSEYEEAESYVVDQAESALDEFESNVNHAARHIGDFNDGLLLVKNIFEEFAFFHVNYFYILFALVIGSVALLIGRKLR